MSSAEEGEEEYMNNIHGVLTLISMFTEAGYRTS